MTRVTEYMIAYTPKKDPTFTCEMSETGCVLRHMHFGVPFEKEVKRSAFASETEYEKALEDAAFDVFTMLDGFVFCWHGCGRSEEVCVKDACAGRRKMREERAAMIAADPDGYERQMIESAKSAMARIQRRTESN